MSNILTHTSSLRWLDCDSASSTGSSDSDDSIPYIDDWQSVYGSPINSYFLTCVDHHDLPPSVIVWASRLSALHLLISEGFCLEKENCQQQIYKRERKQKEAGSEMCNFHSARLMGEERRRQGGERREGRERRAGRGWIFVSEKETELRRLLCMQHLCLIIDFSYMRFI